MSARCRVTLLQPLVLALCRYAPPLKKLALALTTSCGSSLLVNFRQFEFQGSAVEQVAF
jgi:hypothetical protein